MDELLLQDECAGLSRWLSARGPARALVCRAAAEFVSAPADVWQPKPPATSGLWWMLCAECDGEPELVRVDWRHGQLWAIRCSVGSLPLQRYHDGLTNCMWQAVA